MANNEEDYGLSKVQQVVLVAADPHIDDLVVSEPHDVKDSNILQAKVFQMPIKLADEGDKVETKMAALIMVEREDLPLDAQNIIKEEIKEVKASGSDVVPVVPQQFTSKNTIALPPFDPYYYVGKLPSNFANSLTTNVSTNSLSMQRVSVDSTKLVDMLNMAKLSTQISSLNDSIHSFVVTSEPSQSSATSFRGISSSGVYSSSPYRSSDGKPAANDSSRKSESESNDKDH